MRQGYDFVPVFLIVIIQDGNDVTARLAGRTQSLRGMPEEDRVLRADMETAADLHEGIFAVLLESEVLGGQDLFKTVEKLDAVHGIQGEIPVGGGDQAERFGLSRQVLNQLPDLRPCRDRILIGVPNLGHCIL